jgi:predicted nucleotidyltransferase
MLETVDLRHPLRVITPTLDGDILTLLAAGELHLSGREIGRRIGASQEGVRRTLERLVGEGIVLRERAGNAHLYQLNRRHISAPWIERLAATRAQLIDRLREAIGAWQLRPAAAVLFGSAARGDASAESDIDMLVVRPHEINMDDPTWRRQVSELESEAAASTGNDARAIEYSDEEVRRIWNDEPVLAAAAAEGIALFGSLRRLSPRTKRRRRK